MQAEVKWVEDFKFLGTSQSGHSVVMDGNGRGNGAKPYGNGANGRGWL